MSDEKPATCDLENWMENLPEIVKSFPLIYLAIPGSHDSMSYKITSKSELAPDAEPFLQRLKFLGPLLTFFMAKWSKTQTYTAVDQLKSGVRYFDLRLATKKGCDKIYFVHGLYSCCVDEVLNDINQFLNEHPREVVILDCQHFYAFGPADHEKMMLMLISTFSAKLIPYKHSMDGISLNALFHSRQQVFAVYRSDAARFGQPLLWPSANFPSPWPNTVSLPNLIYKLNQYLKSRQNGNGFISQFVLTPTTFFVCKYIYSSLKKKCVLPLETEKYFWIKEQKCGQSGVNVIISDFVDLDDCRFCKEVVNLNYTFFSNNKPPIG